MALRPRRIPTKTAKYWGANVKLSSHVWNELRSPELAAAKEAGAVVLVPIGATEQHGAHLPVNTDIVTATSVSLAAAERIANPPVLVVETASLGFSPHHMLHIGTISLRLETFIALLRDVVISIDRHGFKRIILVNGHGGNIAPLSAFAHEMAGDGLPVLFCSYWDLIKEEIAETMTGWRKAVGHAGEFETSLMLYLRPDHVDPAAAVEEKRPPWNPALASDPIMAAGATFPPLFAANSTGVLGDAIAGSAEKGRVLFDLAADRLVELVRTVAETELPRGSVWKLPENPSDGWR